MSNESKPDTGDFFPIVIEELRCSFERLEKEASLKEISLDDLKSRYDLIISLLDKQEEIPLDPVNILSCALAVNDLAVLSLTNGDLKEALSLNSQANNYLGQYAGFAFGESFGISQGINDSASIERLKKSMQTSKARAARANYQDNAKESALAEYPALLKEHGKRKIAVSILSQRYCRSIGTVNNWISQGKNNSLYME